MWIWMALGSAVLLGLYDVSKKIALSKNTVLNVLLVATGLSALFLSPLLFVYKGGTEDHLRLLLKAVLVSSSWISGMMALKKLPLTVVSTLKASRPFFVLLFSILLFGEQLNLWQWGGVVFALTAVVLLSRTGESEDIDFLRNRGIWAMAVSILTGVASALYDKHILQDMEPLFVQSWTNVYITAILALCVAFGSRVAPDDARPFRWDWMMVVIALLITAADALYFFAVKQDGALLSVISLARRSSVVVTFAIGAIFFKEKNIRSKAVALSVLMVGMVLLLIGS